MASSASKLMLLFLLVGVGACVGEGVSRTSYVGWNTNKAGKEAAGETLARVTMPSALMEHESPLDAKAASLYAAKIEDGSIAQHAMDFCAEAKLLCDGDVNLIDTNLDISLESLLEGGSLLEKAKAMVDAASHATLFAPEDLVTGKDITLPATLHDLYPTTSFLPASLAKLMPLSSAKIADLLQNLNIAPTSNLAAMMSHTMARCDARAQQITSSSTTSPTNQSPAMCVTSMEDMTKFVADRFPQDSHIYALNRTIPAPTDKSAKSDAAYKVLDVKEHEHTVVCRKTMFPFAVYECHNMDNKEKEKEKDVGEKNMKIYAVVMESHDDGRRVNQIASCRDRVGGAEKTRTMGPGLLGDDACHWLSDAFVWAPVTKV